MSDFLEANEDNYKKLIELLDAESLLIRKATNEVYNFVKNKERILYGGQAIDYSLRALKIPGLELYPIEQIPDYDFYSYEHANDAYELSQILADKGYPIVKTINAFHVRTMRVRTNHLYVADISWCPKNIFDQIPYICYDGLKVVHPNLQRIDMHTSISKFYANAPMYNFENRLKKDLTRLLIFEKYYPVIPEEFNLKISKEYDINEIFDIAHKHKINLGLVGFPVFQKSLENAKLLNNKKQKICMIGKKLFDKKIRFVNKEFILCCDDLKNFSKYLEKNNYKCVNWRQSFLEFQPVSCEINFGSNKVIIYEQNNITYIEKIKKSLSYVNLHETLRYFAFRMVFDDPNKIYKAAYSAMMSILRKNKEGKFHEISIEPWGKPKRALSQIVNNTRTCITLYNCDEECPYEDILPFELIRTLPKGYSAIIDNDPPKYEPHGKFFVNNGKKENFEDIFFD